METQKHTHNVRWQASLSNGETVYEDKGDYLELPGELSPWQKLLKHISENNLTITSLSLYTDDGARFNLPSLGKNPKFSAFDQATKPFQYILERVIAKDHDPVSGSVEPNSVDWFTTISALYKFSFTDGVHSVVNSSVIKLSLWVDEQNPKNCWTLVTLL